MGLPPPGLGAGVRRHTLVEEDGRRGRLAVTTVAVEGSQASAGEDSLLLKNGDAPASRGSSTRRVLSLILGEKNYSLIPTSALV